ncbi:hypothetical protein SLS62_010732 [Diatrype stigma]|uniref:Uncharacterized protein n=1 Tax=Diatrype stigma TaxID=117547 RepID=A0AAN9UAZ3_9PEZI
MASPSPFWEELVPALQTLSKTLKSNAKVGLFVCLAAYVPVHFELAFPFQLWLHGLFLIVVVIIGYFAPSVKFSGPIRFAYLEYSEYFIKISKLLQDWWVYAAVFLFLYPGTFYPALLPVLSLSFIAIAVVTWVYVYHEYHKQLLIITGQVAADVSRATLASSTARDFAGAASRYEKELFDAATVARRDSLLASAVRITDFFDCATRAWAALGEITVAVQKVTSKVEAIVDAAENVEDIDKPDEKPDAGDDEEGGGEGDGDEDEEEEESRTQMLARALREEAEKTLSKVGEVVGQVEAAQASVRLSKAAKDQDAKARQAADANAIAAASAVEEVKGKAAESDNASCKAAAAAEHIKGLAEQAVIVATNGEMAVARTLAGSVKSGAEEAWLESGKARQVTDEAHALLIKWLQTKVA